MGWTTRGTGRIYDSLSGTAALIGYFSKKVISYVTLNRKCKKCDLGQSPSTHDCRLNFEGSAKAMEPHAAVKLVNENKILKKCNIEVGVVIADNDSSSISAIRNACTYEVVKQADKNHTSKEVMNALYKIKKGFKELTGPAIKYLQRCFNFCISRILEKMRTWLLLLEIFQIIVLTIMKIVVHGAAITRIQTLIPIQSLKRGLEIPVCYKA